jgi:hypothetical protein
MISLTIKKCKVDIVPIVKGLVSETEAVRSAYGGYEAYAVALGIEEIMALIDRERLIEDHELSELDLVYAHRLATFGEVQSPTPAFCELIDLCGKDHIDVIPLDMSNNEFTTVFINNVTATEFVKEHRMAKKGMKRNFDMSSPSAFVIAWDAYINKVKGYAKVSKIREKYLAEQLVDIAKYRGSLLAVIEVERINNVLEYVNAITNVE